MARPPREHRQCTQCDWVGLTSRGALRGVIFAVSIGLAVLLFTLDILGGLGIGDQLWALVLTILLVSVGSRMLIRGDKCPKCGAPAGAIRQG